MAKKIKVARRKPSLKKLGKKAKELAEKTAQEYADQVSKETRDNMQEFIKALTDLAKEATIFLAKKNGTLAEALTPAAPAPTAAPAAASAPEKAPEAAPARTRRTKAQIAADEAAADPLSALGLPTEPEAPAAPAPKPMTEKESLDALMATAMAYVQKFGKVEGTAMAKAHLKPYKAEKITALTHEQRIPYIETLKAELAK